MSMKTPIGREARARLLLMLQEKEYSVLTGLISSYRGGKLDPHRAFGYIGELANVRSLISSLEDERKAEVRATETDIRRR